jgi:adenylate cyclase
MSERYDRDLADIFAVQDEITQAVTIAIAPAIADAEQQRAMRRPPGSLDAWAAYQRGLWHVSKFTSSDTSLAERCFQQAIELDPTFSAAYAGLAIAQSAWVDLQARDLAEVMRSNETLVRQAIALDGADAEALSVLSNALWVHADYEGALAEAQRALEMSPNFAYAHHMLGTTLIFSGRPKEGVAALERSIRLDPRHPRSAVRLNQMALGLYFAGEYAAAEKVAKQAIRIYPDFPHPYRWLAAALGQLGLIAEAREALEKAIAVVPGALETNVRERVPWMLPEDHAHMLEGLRKAGWRED